MKLQTTADLLITQWRDKPKIRALVQIWLDVLQEEIGDPLAQIREYLSIDGAEGVWLDHVGERLGVRRPWADSTAVGTWGFDAAGTGFDQGPIEGLEPLEVQAPTGDDLYRRILKARAITLVSSGTLEEMRRAVKLIDPGGIAVDVQDMSFRVTTSCPTEVRLADQLGALPHPAGVRMEVVAGGAFGFDDAGVGFDQGYMRAA